MSLEEIVLKHALINAIKYGGKASVQAVIGKVLAENPLLKKDIEKVVKIAEATVNRVNEMSISEQKALLEKLFPGTFAKKRRKETKKTLPPLPNAEKYKEIRTRFAPNPDFVLTLGNARPAILSYEYARMYRGKFILRFEDTDPRTKRPIKEAYSLIKEDLKWLKVSWDEEYIQSLRMHIYYQYARELLEQGGAYICRCPPSTVKEYRAKGIRCQCAQKPVEDQLELWDKMLEGAFKEGEAVYRVKTDPKCPDPSVRDWIAFRIIDTTKYPHPLVGDKFIVWPTYNFACAIDDHEMKITHILRAKEHISNTIKQKYLYKHMGWNYPEAIHFGRLKLEGFILSKSKIRAGIEKGLYEGPDDIRLGTLMALRKRGFLPESIWDLILEVGIKSSEATISFINLCSLNRKYLEPRANRYMFVCEPMLVEIETKKDLIAKISNHPSYPERGYRKIVLHAENNIVSVYVSREDILKNRNKPLRLMGLVNITIDCIQEKKAKARLYRGDIRDIKAAKGDIVQWVPASDNVKTKVIRVKNNNIVIEEGLAEPSIKSLKVGERIQFIRYGFAKLDEIKEDETRIFIYIHD
ncbi:MAG: glutamate--tRNA ligase [Thermoprotei archaeon]|nr:MAG: glutamate--tRNA ligase [Thermoprotei archaeon]RLE99266.1 MAG: glutamate--tRNA ligase [Thermoprotei archaeon]